MCDAIYREGYSSMRVAYTVLCTATLDDRSWQAAYRGASVIEMFSKSAFDQRVTTPA